MEISHSLSCKLLRKNLYCSAPILPSRVPSIPLSLIPSSNSFSKLVEFRSAVRRQRCIIGLSYASGIRASSADDGERCILEPVGDGDSRHIGFKVPMPDDFEIASNAVTVGRFPQKAYMVILVATGLFNLDSFRSSRPNPEGGIPCGDGFGQHKWNIHQREAIKTQSGNSRCCIVFGDIHLAMFLVLKTDNVKPPTDAEESPEQPEAGNWTETIDAVTSAN